MSNNNLSFSVRLQMLNDEFNANIRQSQQVFQQSSRTMADSMGLLDTESKRLTTSFNNISQKKDLIQQFRNVKTATVEAKNAWQQAQATTSDLAKQWDNAKTKVESLKNAMNAQGNATKEQKAQLREAEREAKNLGTAFDKSSVQAGKLKNNFDQLNSNLQRTRTAMGQAGLSTTNLAQQQKALEAEAQQAQHSLAQLAGEVRNFDNLAKARRTLGLDVDDKARKQIAQLNQAFAELKNSGTLTQTELARASDLHSEHLKKLERELGITHKSTEQLFNVRSSSTINAEINTINAELATLKNRFQQGAISQQEFNRIAQAGQARLHALETELQGTSNDLKKVEKSSQDTGKGMGSLQSAFGGLQGILGALGVSMGAMELIQLADKFKTVEAQVKLATGEGKNFVTGFAGVQQVANATFMSIENTADLFGKLSRAGQQLGVSQKDLLQITQTINQSIKLSGGGAEAAEAAITQLAQGLSSGVLRGDEFNSVMEQSPRLARALADGLGVGIGQLRTMANDGKLTSETIITALKKQSQTINDEFASLPVTVDNSLILLKNNVMKFVGDIDKDLRTSTDLANFIQNIAKGIDNLDPAMINALKQSFEGVKKIVIEVGTQLYHAYEMVNSFLNVLGGTSHATEQVGFLTRALQGVSIIIGTISDGFSAIGIASDAVLGIVLKSIGYVTEKTAEFFGYTNTLAKDMMAKGDEMLARSQKNALAFKSTTVAALDDAAKTNQDRLNDTADKSKVAYEQIAKDGKASAEKIQEAFIKYAQDTIDANHGVVDSVLQQKIEAQNLKVEIDKAGKSHLVAADTTKKSFMELYEEGKKSGMSYWDSLLDTAHKAKAESDFVDMRASLQVLYNTGKIGADDLAKGLQFVNIMHKDFEVQTEKNMSAFADFAQKSINENKGQISAELEKQAAAQGFKLTLGQQGQVYISLAADATKSASEIKNQYSAVATGLGVDFDKALTSVSTSFNKSDGDVSKLASKMNEFKAAGIDASLVVAQGLQGMLAQAKNPADLDVLIKKIQQYGAEGKISGQQTAEMLIEARNKSDELKVGINSTAEAMHTLGQKSQDEINLDAQKAKQSYDMIVNDHKTSLDQRLDAYQKYVAAVALANNGLVSDSVKAQQKMGIQTKEALNQQAQIYKQSFDAIEKDNNISLANRQQAFEKTVQAAIDADDKIMLADLKSQAVARGYGDVIEENGKKVFKNAQEIEEIHKKEDEKAEERKKARIEQAHAQVEAMQQAEAAQIEAGKQADEATRHSMDGIAGALAGAYDKLTSTISSGLQEVGVSSEQAHEIFMKRIKDVNDMGAIVTSTDFGGFNSLFANLQALQKQTEENIAAFNATRQSAISMTATLGNADVTVNDLAEAENALYQASNANVQGIARMDKATLRNLQNAIDSTKQKMQSLAQTALQTEQDLEASLASMKGDDMLAMKLEQTRKLSDLQTKLQEAQKRSNVEEIAHYQHAIELQNQINATQTAQAQEKAQQEVQQKAKDTAKTNAQTAAETILNTQKAIVPTNTQPSVPTIITPPVNTIPVNIGGSGKTINVNLQLAGKTLNATVPADKEADIEAFLQALERSQAVSGK